MNLREIAALAEQVTDFAIWTHHNRPEDLDWALQVRDSLRAAVAEVRALREALAPFAAWSTGFIDDSHANATVAAYTSATLHDLRRAAQVLARITDEPGVAP